jgi:hypothetical protein
MRGSAAPGQISVADRRLESTVVGVNVARLDDELVGRPARAGLGRGVDDRPPPGSLQTGAVDAAIGSALCELLPRPENPILLDELVEGQVCANAVITVVRCVIVARRLPPTSGPGALPELPENLPFASNSPANARFNCTNRNESRHSNVLCEKRPDRHRLDADAKTIHAMPRLAMTSPAIGRDNRRAAPVRAFPVGCIHSTRDGRG